MAPYMMGGSQNGLSMGVRCVAFPAAVMVANLPDPAFAQSACPGMHMRILNMRSSTGTLACALSEAPDGFPEEHLRAACGCRSAASL